MGEELRHSGDSGLSGGAVGSDCGSGSSIGSG